MATISPSMKKTTQTGFATFGDSSPFSASSFKLWAAAMDAHVLASLSLKVVRMSHVSTRAAPSAPSRSLRSVSHEPVCMLVLMGMCMYMYVCVCVCTCVYVSRSLRSISHEPVLLPAMIRTLALSGIAVSI